MSRVSQVTVEWGDLMIPRLQVRAKLLEGVHGARPVHVVADALGIKGALILGVHVMQPAPA